jgi:hypothetical protein
LRPGGALSVGGQPALGRPAVWRRFAGGRPVRLLPLGGFRLHCLDDAAKDPDYGHHNNEQDIHPSLVIGAPLGQD